MYNVTFWIEIEEEEIQVASWEQPSDPNFQVGDIMNFDIHNSIYAGHKLYNQTRTEEELIKSLRHKKLVIIDKGNWVKIWVDGKKDFKGIEEYYSRRTMVNVEYRMELRDV